MASRHYLGGLNCFMIDTDLENDFVVKYKIHWHSNLDSLEYSEYKEV